MKRVYQFSVKYASLLVVPVVAAVMALSEPGSQRTLRQHIPNRAPIPCTACDRLRIRRIREPEYKQPHPNSQGHTKFILKTTILTACVGIPIGSVLVLNFGVLGLIITSLIEGLPSLVVSLYWIRKHYGTTVDWSASARIILSSAVAAALTYAVIFGCFV